MDLLETIKAILDKDCTERLSGKCTKGLVLVAKYNNPDELGPSMNLCWLCHENDNLAHEIFDAVQRNLKSFEKQGITPVIIKGGDLDHA